MIVGMGSAVAEVLLYHAPVPQRRVGIPDVFGESGEYDELLEKFGLTTRNIVTSAREIVRRKK
jgi:transketolase